MEDKILIKDSAYENLNLLTNSSVSYTISLDSTEALTQESFSSLISLANSHKKSLIIAVVKTRDIEQPSYLHPFYFHAYQLNKLLFKTKENGDLISRHSKNTPLCALNPMTNLPIIGEVEYFITTDTNTAEFIGTDYTYTQSANLQEIFKNNSIVPEDLMFVRFQSHIEDFGELNFDMGSLNILEEVIEAHRNSLLSQIRVPFKKAVFFGISLVVYYVLFVFVINTGRIKFINAFNDEVTRFSAEEVAQMIALVIASMWFDKYICDLFNIVEEKYLYYSKIVTWVALGGAIGLSFTTDSIIILASCSGMLIGYSVYHQIYSISLFTINYSLKKLT